MGLTTVCWGDSCTGGRLTGGEEVEEVPFVNPFTYHTAMRIMGIKEGTLKKIDKGLPTSPLLLGFRGILSHPGIWRPAAKRSHLQVLCHREEGAELCLGNVDLSVVHEVEDGEDALVLDALQVEQGVAVRVPLQHCTEERGAGGENHLRF